MSETELSALRGSFNSLLSTALWGRHSHFIDKGTEASYWHSHDSNLHLIPECVLLKATLYCLWIRHLLSSVNSMQSTGESIGSKWEDLGSWNPTLSLVSSVTMVMPLPIPGSELLNLWNTNIYLSHLVRFPREELMPWLYQQFAF